LRAPGATYICTSGLAFFFEGLLAPTPPPPPFAGAGAVEVVCGRARIFGVFIAAGVCAASPPSPPFPPPPALFPLPLFGFGTPPAVRSPPPPSFTVMRRMSFCVCFSDASGRFPFPPPPAAFAFDFPPAAAASLAFFLAHFFAFFPNVRSSSAVPPAPPPVRSPPPPAAAFSFLAFAFFFFRSSLLRSASRLAMRCFISALSRTGAFPPFARSSAFFSRSLRSSNTSALCIATGSSASFSTNFL